MNSKPGRWWDRRSDRYTSVPPVRRRRPPPDYDDVALWMPVDVFVVTGRALRPRYPEHLAREDLDLLGERVIEVARWYAARPKEVPPRQLLHDLEAIIVHFTEDDEMILTARVLLSAWPPLTESERQAMRDLAFEAAVLD